METLESIDDCSKFTDFFVFLIQDLYIYCYSIACASNQLVRRFFENIQLAGLIDSVNEKLEDHPILKFIIFGATTSFLIPVLLFLVFAIASFIITFAAFVLIEGIILAAGGLCMCVCLITMAMMMSILAVSIGAFHFAAVKLNIYSRV